MYSITSSTISFQPHFYSEMESATLSMVWSMDGSLEHAQLSCGVKKKDPNMTQLSIMFDKGKPLVFNIYIRTTAAKSTSW